MSTSITQYTELITSEHIDKPNFVSTVAFTVAPFVSLSNVLSTIPALFDLDTAIGNQLDILGQWIGQSRNIEVPLTNVYFAFDTPGLGWDQGTWLGPYDPTEGLTTLADADYRVLLKATIAANYWNGTVSGAAAVLADLFTNSETPGTLIFVEDNYNMTMNYVIAGQPPVAVFRALLSEGYIDLKPGAVGVNYLIGSGPGAVFGFDVDNNYIQGWDQGSWATTL